MKKKTVTVNGKIYDAMTGRLVDSSGGDLTPNNTSSAVHASTQKSSTLNRRYIKKVSVTPLKKIQTTEQKIALEQLRQRRAMAIKMNEEARQRILSSHKKGVITPITSPVNDKTSPIPAEVPTKSVDYGTKVPEKVQLANRMMAQKKAEVRHLTAGELKDRAIRDAFDRAADMNIATEEHHKKKRSRSRVSRRFVSAFSMTMAIALLAGYLVYINMPNISIKVAAMRAGIDASYPSYQPSGYTLKGMVTFKNGGVEMEFASSGDAYVLAQSKSSWDSSALLSNYVKPNWGGNYTITKDHGLIIYLNERDGDAAWVSGGILYVIDGNELTSEQIRGIATSL